MYRGIGSVAVGSAPGAALFFAMYDTSKNHLTSMMSNHSAAYLVSASLGEATACLIRVPMENVKQKMQAGLYQTSSETVAAIAKQGIFKGFFTGYLSTLAREVPFSALQFPLYEFFKASWSQRQGREVSPFQASLCGALGGGISAFLTTPLDVVKTRLMLGSDAEGVAYKGFVNTFSRVNAEVQL